MREQFGGLLLGQRHGITLMKAEMEMVNAAIEKEIRGNWLIYYAGRWGCDLTGKPFEYDRETGRLTWVEPEDVWEVQGVA